MRVERETWNEMGWRLHKLEHRFTNYYFNQPLALNFTLEELEIELCMSIKWGQAHCFLPSFNHAVMERIAFLPALLLLCSRFWNIFYLYSYERPSVNKIGLKDISMLINISTCRHPSPFIDTGIKRNLSFVWTAERALVIYLLTHHTHIAQQICYAQIFVQYIFYFLSICLTNSTSLQFRRSLVIKIISSMYI